MFYRYILAVTLLISACGEAKATLQEYIHQVSEKCPDSSTLLIKKSLIELKGSNQCDAKFTKQLIGNCINFNCSHLVENYKKNILGRSGSVVGE